MSRSRNKNSGKRTYTKKEKDKTKSRNEFGNRTDYNRNRQVDKRRRPDYERNIEYEEDYSSNLIEGRNPVLEALKSRREIDKLFIQKGNIEGSIKQIIAIARDKGVLIKEVDKGKLDRISVTKSHQGVIASAAMYKYYEIDEILQVAAEKDEDPFLVILDEITDPQNLGSILRSCDGAGVHGVIIPERRSASLTPIIGKTSAGAVEYVPVSKVTNINQTIAYLKEKGFWIAGADIKGEVYYEKDLTGPLAVVIGSE